MSGTLPEAGAKLTLDLSEWESNWSSVMGDAETLQSTLDDLTGSVDVEVNLDIPDTSEIEDIQSLDGETITPELDTTETETSKEIRDGINFLATVEKIKIAIDVVGTALQFIKDMGSIVVNPFLDVEDAVAKINAQTGGTGIEDLGQFIRDIQAADLGENVDQISEVVIAAKQLGAPIDEATRAALTFTHTFQDENPVDVLTTLNTLVETGLVPNLQDAADLMTVAFQNSANKGNDLLGVVSANAQSWADMGLNGTEALSAINSLTQGNVDSATDAAKALQTLDDALTTAADNADSPQAEALKTLGMENPKDSGQAMGADFIDGFAASFANLPANQQDLVSGVLFGKVGKKFTGALGGLTTQDGPFGDVVGAAADAATEIDNSLRGAIDDFVTEANAKLDELLSSSAIDLPGKIKALKEGLQEGVDVLANGGTVGDALEVALNIPGLSDTLNTFIGNFERIIGNLEIAFLQVVATIQEITGHGEEAKGTRATIAGLAQNQLAFDLQLGNPDEVGAQVAQALSRGVSGEQVGTTVMTAINESIAKGNFDQGGGIIEGLIQSSVKAGKDPAVWNELAGRYVTKLQDGFANAMSAGNVNLMQDMIAINPNAKVPGLDDAVVAMKQQLSDAFAPAAGGANADNPFTKTFQGISTAFTDAFPGQGKQGTTSNSLLGGLITAADDTVTKLNDADTFMSASFDHIQTATQETADAATTDMATVGTAFDTAAVEAALMDQNIALSLTENTVTASFEAVALAAQTAFPTVIDWFNRTTQAAAVFDAQVSGHVQHLLGLLHDLQFLSAQVATGVQQALTLGAGLGGGGNVTTNNVTVNNNVQGNAAAVANGYTIAASIRNGG